jgi:hypothetical protein
MSSRRISTICGGRGGGSNSIKGMVGMSGFGGVDRTGMIGYLGIGGPDCGGMGSSGDSWLAACWASCLAFVFFLALAAALCRN